MDLMGRLLYRARDFKTGSFLLTFAIDEIPPGVDKLPEGDLTISLKKYKQKRSLNANNLYWAMIGKIAEAVEESRYYVHNMMLRDYAPLKFIDGEPVTVFLPDTDRARREIDNDQYRHVAPTGYTVTRKGMVLAEYHELKGSHELDTKEMARLIEGTIAEARALGISTITDEEMERMLA